MREALPDLFFGEKNTVCSDCDIQSSHFCIRDEFTEVRVQKRLPFPGKHHRPDTACAHLSESPVHDTGIDILVSRLYPVKSTEDAAMVAPVGRANLDINRVTVPGREPFAHAFRMIYQLMVFSFDLHEMARRSTIIIIPEKEKGRLYP